MGIKYYELELEGVVSLGVDEDFVLPEDLKRDWGYKTKEDLFKDICLYYSNRGNIEGFEPALYETELHMIKSISVNVEESGWRPDLLEVSK
jgi:hypothetical protein